MIYAKYTFKWDVIVVIAKFYDFIEVVAIVEAVLVSASFLNEYACDPLICFLSYCQHFDPILEVAIFPTIALFLLILQF